MAHTDLDAQKFSVYIYLYPNSVTGDSRLFFPSEHRCCALLPGTPTQIRECFVEFREGGYEVPMGRNLLAWLSFRVVKDSDAEDWVGSQFYLTEGLHRVGRGRVLRVG